MRVFLDTNVLVSAFATRGLCEDVMREVLLRHQLILSDALLKELNSVLKEKIGLAGDLIKSIIEMLNKDSEIANAPERAQIPAQDEDDVVILSDALYGKAEAFITGDQEVLALGNLGEMLVLSPRMFWEKLRVGRH